MWALVEALDSLNWFESLVAHSTPTMAFKLVALLSIVTGGDIFHGDSDMAKQIITMDILTATAYILAL